MTTLLLQGADSLVGGIAGTAAAYAGNALSAALGGTGSAADSLKVVQGPRLTEMSGLTSTEGAPIPRLYGRARIGGQLIWATRFEEVVNTTTSVERQPSRGGKSLASKGATKTTVTTTYSYNANIAVGLCEGPIAFVRRVWADGSELDLTTLTMRVHAGSADQTPDPLIVAKEGAENAPSYRGLAYVVFERLPLAAFGNRVPQLSFEVVRAVDGLRQMIRSVCLIPGSTEFGYDTLPVADILGLGASQPENVHQLQRTTDIAASLDWLQALCPNLESVSLVVAWFGDDLRAGQCRIAPRVDLSGKATSGAEWSVAGLSRSSAAEVSRSAGIAAYGGTPSDGSVTRLIGELKARGLAVTLYPFVMMDVAAGNDLVDPQTGEAGQPAYPWRGRITCEPAPGCADTVDGTAAATDQLAAFFGIAAAADFSEAGGTVAYAGPDEWSLRRHVLHYAALSQAAGGVDAFIVGSELVGLTRVRSGPGTYPAVAALKALAGEVRSIVGPATKLTYAADWTEYGAHVLDAGSEVRFPLDPLWADPAIDAVGIDFYPPLSDWRDEPDHADLAQASSIYDVDYLRQRVASGEAFDWFYASEADRAAQLRTSITDGAYGKPWTFRAKDLAGWWGNAHVERVGGVETAPTVWSAGAKPIWLTEIGVPAVDKGPNGPNVFPDPKSSESELPPFSLGTRDDLVQARALEAILSRFDPTLPGHQPPFNPEATAYSGRMIDPSHVSIWAWDGRPFPAFPDFDLVWADGANWETGHWITGRIEGAPLDRLVAAILSDAGLAPSGAVPLDGFADGYLIDRPMSARDAIEPLGRLFGFDAVAGPNGIGWRGRGGTVDLALSSEDLVASGSDPVVARSRAQETDLPHAIELGFTDAEGEYARAAAGSRRLAGSSRRELSSDVAAVLQREEAQRLADIWLQDAWAGRETVEFSLSPRAMALEPGDVVSLAAASGSLLHRVVGIVDGAARRVSARAVEPSVFATARGAAGGTRRRSPPAVPGPVEAIILDLPVAASDPPALQYLAVAADPWPGAVAVWRAAGEAGFSLQAMVGAPAILGRTLSVMAPGPVWRWDTMSSLDVVLSGASLTAIDDMAALAGGNLLALQGADGGWEIFSAAAVELVGERSYRVSRFLRGLAGTEPQAGRAVPAGASLVRLDETVVALTTAVSDLGQAYRYRAGPADRDYGDPTYVELTASVGASALMPFSPVRVGARRSPAGVTVAWIRRTRIDGDSWDLAEVPLGEESERYELDILGGGAVLRTLAASAPSVLYAGDQEIADFGAPQAALSLRVFQISAAIGRGFGCDVTVPIV